MGYLTADQHAAGLRLLQNLAGCYYCTNSEKVIASKQGRRDLMENIEMLVLQFNVTKKEVLEYAKASRVCVIEEDGKFLFGKSEM